MPGEPDFDPVEAAAADVDDYSAAFGLPSVARKNVDAYLALTVAELEAMPLQRLKGIAAEIEAAAYRLQDETNRAQLRVARCTYEITRLVGRVANKQPAYKDEDKLVLAALAHEEAAELLAVRQRWTEYLIRWQGLGARLERFSARIYSMAHKERSNAFD